MRLVFLIFTALIAGSIFSTTLAAQTTGDAVVDSCTKSTQELSNSTQSRYSQVYDSYRRGMRTTTIVRVRANDELVSSDRPFESGDGTLAQNTNDKSKNAIRTVRFDSPVDSNSIKSNRTGYTHTDRGPLSNKLLGNARSASPVPYSGSPNQRPVRDLIYKQPKVDQSVWQNGGDEFSGFGVDSYFNSSSSCNEWKSFCKMKSDTYLNPCFALRPGDGDCCQANGTVFSCRNRRRLSRCPSKGPKGCQDCGSQ